MTALSTIDIATEPNEPVLQSRFAPRYALGLPHVLVVLLLTALAAIANHLPLRGTDLWTHVTWGRWIAAHGAIPTADPVMWTAEGMRVVDTCWLAQLVLALVQSSGDEYLRTLFAALQLASFVVLARALWENSRSLGPVLVGLVATLVVGWSRLATIRPESFAGVLFAIVLLLAGRVQRGALSRGFWPVAAATIACMALWANLHGSFVCGLAVFAALWLGQVAEQWQRTGCLWHAAVDRESCRRLWLCELAALATLANPYGIELWLETLRFSANANLRDLVEWFPLSIGGAGGWEFFGSIAILLVLVRHSRLPMPAAHALLLALFAAMTLLHVRMIGWYAMVFAWMSVPHAADVWTRWRSHCRAKRFTALPARDSSQSNALADLWRSRSWRWSLVASLFLWIGLMLTDMGRSITGGNPPGPRQLYGPDAPLAASEFLRKHPPDGTIYCPQAWADWLVCKGPKNVRPLVTSNVHLVPAQVWQDYLQIHQARPGWPQTLERYGVQTLVLDKSSQAILAGVVRRSAEWKITHEDQVALVAERKRGGRSMAPPAAPLAKQIDRSAR